MHRIDCYLTTTSGIMYYVSLKDRTSLSAAAIAGMAVELELIVGFRYVWVFENPLRSFNWHALQSTIALVFFITYVLCQMSSRNNCSMPQNWAPTVLSRYWFFLGIVVVWSKCQLYSLDWIPFSCSAWAIRSVVYEENEDSAWAEPR